MTSDNSTWQPYQEPLRTTLLRNGAIILILGAVLAWRGGGLALLPMVALLLLWPTFGGHFVELGFLNVLRPRLPVARAVQVAVRVVAWFMAGAVMVAGMRLTGMAFGGTRPRHWPAWWLGGVAFITVELIAHLVLLLRKRPNFYDGRG